MVFGADWNDPDRPMPPAGGRAYSVDELRATVRLAPPTSEVPPPNIVTVHLWIGTCEKCGAERASLKLGLCDRCRPAARP